MIRNRIALLGGAFCSFGLLGLLFPAVGASLPAIGEALAVGIGRLGLLLAAFQGGYTLFCLLGGVVSDLVGRRPVLIAGALLYAAGGLLLGRWTGFAPNAALFAVLGLGAGLIYISSNTLVIELFPERRALVLNLHHLIYAAGTLVSPVLLSAAGGPWHAAYGRFGLIALALAVLFLLSRPPAPAEPLNGTPPRARLAHYGRLVDNPLFLQLLAAGLLGIGAQFGITYLLVSLLVQARGVSLRSAGLVLSLFFLAVAAGRLVTGWLAARFSNTRLILGSLTLLSGTLLGAWLARGLPSQVLFVASGLAFSALMPCLLALASAILSREVMGAALGLVATAAGLGGLLIPPTASWLAARVGLERSFFLVIAAAFVSAGGFWLLRGRFSAAESKERARSG